jgi:hypothetical protein
VLRRATDAGQDVRGREGGKAGRERLGDESPAEEQPTRPQQLPPGDERVSEAKLSWTTPAAKAPPAARKAIVSTPTLKSSVIFR